MLGPLDSFGCIKEGTQVAAVGKLLNLFLVFPPLALEFSLGFGLNVATSILLLFGVGIILTSFEGSPFPVKESFYFPTVLIEPVLVLLCGVT